MKIRTDLLWGCTAALLIAACQSIGGNKTGSEQTTSLDTTSKSFKREYERGNGTKSKSGKTYISITVQSDSNILYATEEEILNIQNGIVLFAFPTCPWARNTIEPLIDFASEENVKIHYLNIAKIRDQKELQQDSTTVVTIDGGTDGYLSLLNKFSKTWDPYKGLGIDTIRRIYSPTVLFIKNSEAFEKKSGTVESQKDAYVKLTADQHDELKQIYKSIYTRYK